MFQRQHNGLPLAGVAEVEIEVKQEPPLDNYADEENNSGFAGFANVSPALHAADEEAQDLWTNHATASLIAQYNQHYRLVGQSARVRSRREMFEIISLEMQKIGYRFGPRKCENKWRVLERKYKNLLLREKLKKPGRIKHYTYWEHRRSMDEVFSGEKRSSYTENFQSSSGPPKLAARDVELGDRSKEDQSAEALEKEARGAEKSDGASDEVTVAVLQSLLAEVNKGLALAEVNRERRHREKMAVRRAELEVHRNLLKLKEQKMELCKSQMTSAAQTIKLMK